MTRETKSKIRKLGFVELKAFIKDKSAEIDKLSEGFNVSIGLEGMKKHVRKAMRIKECAEAIEYASARLKRGMSIEEKEHRKMWIDSIMKMTSLEEASE